jgi:hypothetical protein
MVYEFDYYNNIITFNRTISAAKHGKKPNGDIFFKLKRENAKIVPSETGHSVNTRFAHDAIKENISIYQVSEDDTVMSFKLRNLASVHRLNKEEIKTLTIISDTSSVLQTVKPFINGVVELKNIGDYSIDKKRGVIFTFNPLNSTNEVLVEVTYNEKIPLTFDITNGHLLTTAAITKKNKTFNATLLSQAYIVDIGSRNIEEKSILFTNIPISMTTEVLYKNIDVEFNEAGTTGKYAIDYENGILYLQNKASGLFSGILVNTNYFIEYNITYKIPETFYSIVPAEKKIEFTDKFVSHFFNISANEVLSASLLKVEYSFAEEIKESTSELFPYTTPFIMEYKIITTPKESL